MVWIEQAPIGEVQQVMKLSNEGRSLVLMVVTGLVVAYVRDFLQYHRYMWNSFSQFLVSWLIHFVALLLFLMFSYPAIVKLASFFIDKPEDSIRDMNEHFVYVPIIVLLAAIAVFILANWVPVGDGPPSDIGLM